MNWLKRFVLVVAGLLAAVELFVRLMGMNEFPVYGTDDELGYFIAPNQKGVFLHRNHWEFNEYGMGAGPFRPEGKRNLLLLGDSIVLGGNPLDQSVRLGPTLERKLGEGWAVWPAAAQSWSSLNEAVYLKRYPQVVAKMEWLVWVMNDGDFQGLSRWRSDFLNPRHRPLWESFYVFERQVWINKVEPRLPIASLLVPPDPLGSVPFDARMPDLEAYVPTLKRDYPGLHILLVWYPEEAELHPPPGDFYLKASARLKAFARTAGVSFVDLAEEPGWGPADYRDTVHPSAAGNRAFSAILQRKIGEGGGR